ncbi:hypothetical protein, partial [Phenylobacterium sp.]|uniref:hypothetical protein n=1 Tax=Phenylobacterium sp. TaxID=1871053 RepID=UPI002F3E2212
QAPAQLVVSDKGPGAVKTKLPDPIIEEARVLEASAQAIAKAALAKLKAQHKTNPDADEEQAELEKGQKDFTAASKEIYGDTGMPSSGSSAPDSSAGYASDGAAAPAAAPAPPLVSIQA